MIYADKDPFTDADRYDVLINEKIVKSIKSTKVMRSLPITNTVHFNGRAKFAPVKEGNIEVHWPEGNAILPEGVYEQYAGIPEYNAAVIVEKAETYLCS